MNASIKILLPTAILLFASGSQGIASAQDHEMRWVAELSAGPQRDCNGVNTHWSIVETDGDFIALSYPGVQWHVSTRNLNADGSGRVEGTDSKGKPFWLEFEPGHGPRKILFNGLYKACVWRVTPLKAKGKMT